MKIAIVINDLCIRGGSHKQVLRLCQYLRSQDICFGIYTKYYDPDSTYREFSEFDVVSLKRQPTQFETGGTIFQRYKRSREKKAEDRQLMNLIPNDVDVFNFHDNGMLWMMKWAKTERHAKVVWQINDLPVCYRVWLSESHRKSIGNRISRLAYKSVLPLVDRITVNVTKNKDRVVELMKKDAEVFYCGVDVNEGLKMHVDAIHGRKCRILSAGVFFPRRNYETLVKVIELLRERGIDARLDIIGSTELEPLYVEQIRRQIQESSLYEHVTIWGQVNEEKYNILFNESDIFAFININQSWGLAVFEAMSCGLPTIVSNSVGAIELLHDRQDAIIVDPLDVEEICGVVMELISDEAFYKKLSLNGSNAVKEYTWDKLYSSKMLNVFRELSMR